MTIQNCKVNDCQKRLLVALLQETIPFINDAGNDEDPEAQARANDLFVRIAAALSTSDGEK